MRIRVAGDHSYITIKGTNAGATRAEFEYEIPLDDAQALLPMCQPPLIEKTRYRIEHGGLTWEVDVFEGENAGLMMAEVELPSTDTHVEIPGWIGEEVTGDARYYNANLVARPFTRWGQDGLASSRAGVAALAQSGAAGEPLGWAVGSGR